MGIRKVLKSMGAAFKLGGSTASSMVSGGGEPIKSIDSYSPDPAFVAANIERMEILRKKRGLEKSASPLGRAATMLTQGKNPLVGSAPSNSMVSLLNKVTSNMKG